MVLVEDYNVIHALATNRTERVRRELCVSPPLVIIRDFPL
jgi:hypothetical protein